MQNAEILTDGSVAEKTPGLKVEPIPRPMITVDDGRFEPSEADAGVFLSNSELRGIFLGDFWHVCFQKKKKIKSLMGVCILFSCLIQDSKNGWETGESSTVRRPRQGHARDLHVGRAVYGWLRTY
jgi:hypothetical protein